MFETLASAPLAARAIAVLLATVLDALLGDPQVSWHPVRLLGSLSAGLERWSRGRFRDDMAGIVTWLLVIIVTVAVGAGLLVLAGFAGEAASIVAGGMMIYVTMSARDLAAHARRVRVALGTADLDGARGRLAFMVSRDTSQMTVEEVTRGTVESVSENLGDGVIAPLFFAALFGPLGALIYRAINTMDAMFGYRNERYLRFGRFSARADDLANYLPARLSGTLVCLAGSFRRWPGTTFRSMIRYAPLHESPNAGYPEAATAAVLGVRLGGPGIYHGKVKQKAYLGEAEREIVVTDIDRSIRLMWISMALFTAVVVSVLVLV